MKKLFNDWKRILFLGLVILAIALFLRLIKLTYLPVFVDEAIYIRWSQIMINESTLRFLPLSDGKQPLFMWTDMAFLKLFADPLFAGRFLSTVTGLGTLVGICVSSYYLFKSPKVSLLAGLLYALSPFAVFFDRLALVDSMLSMFGVWTFFFGMVMAKTKRLDVAMVVGFSLGGAVLTKSPGIFFALLLPTTWLISDMPKVRNKKVIHFTKLFLLLLISYAIAFGMYNVLRLGPNFHLLGQRNYDYVYPYTRIFTSPLDPLKGHLGGIRTYALELLPVSAFVLFVLGIVLGLRRIYLRRTLLLLAWVVLPILVMAEFSKVVTARYVLFVLPYVFILASGVPLTAKKNLKNIAIAVIGVFVIQSLYINYQLLTKVEAATLPQGERSGYVEEWTAGWGIKEVAEFIKQENQKDPKTKIVVGTEGYFGTLPNGLEMYLEGVDNVVIIGVGLGISDIPKSLRESKDAGNKTYLLVNTSRFTGNADKLGLKEVASYPHPARTPGTLEYRSKGPQEIMHLFELTW